MGAPRLLFVALCVAAAISPALSRTFLSQTSEQVSQTTSLQLCPDSPHEVEQLGDFELPQYVRQPLRKQRHLRVGVHKSAAQQNHTHQPQDLPGTADRLADIYAAPVVLPSLALQNGVSNLGDMRRLERFLYKLLSGEAVTVVALGGSVTAGHGVENLRLGWMARTFAWINATSPHPEHRLLNHAIPGVSSAYVGYCMESLVPSDADLVFMEFTWNDYVLEPGIPDMNTTARRGLEKMMRKLLASRPGTAVVNMHFHPFPSFKEYWGGIEGRMEDLMKYYGVPSLSSRSALHTLFNEQPWLLRKVWPPGDDIHPSCVGCRFLADIMVAFLQDVAAHVALAGHDRLPHADMAAALPPPAVLFQTSEDRPDVCTVDAAFKSLASVDRGNWTWVDESRRPGPPKLGYVSWQPGDVMTLKVPLDGVLPALGQDRRMLVAVGFLVSYEHMGKVGVGCSGGCSCPAKEFNCHLPSSQRFSLTYWKGLTVTLDEGSQACELRVTNANQTDSGEHKVKLTSLLVSLDTEGFIHNGNGDVV